MITGSLVALITPMMDDGSVDKNQLNELVEFHIAQGTHGIVAVGTTGESATLNYEEHADVIRQVVQLVKGRVPVIAGTGANSTHEAIDLTKRAKQAGADACLLVTPYYNKPTQEGMFLHFKAIAEAVDIPQILYNVPGRTACDMSNETVLRLSTIKNIIGLKDATGDVARGQALIEAVCDQFAIYSGDDGTAVDLMIAGAKGNISVTANIAPKKVAEAADFALSNQPEKARAVDAEITALHENLFVEANPIPVKWAAHKMGLCGAGIRLPLTPLSKEFRSQLEDAMTRSGITI